MKKILSLVLVIVMMMSMTVTAFAAGEQSGTSTVTAVVPEPVPEYTIHIPADVTLEYGNGERQLVGEVSVSEVKNLQDAGIYVKITTAPLKSGDNEIPVVFEWNHKDNVDYDDDFYNGKVLYTQSSEEYRPIELCATVTEADWKAAKPGTYTSTITYDFKFY